MCEKLIIIKKRSEPTDQLSNENDEDWPESTNATYGSLEFKVFYLNDLATTHSMFDLFILTVDV